MRALALVVVALMSTGCHLLPGGNAPLGAATRVPAPGTGAIASPSAARPPAGGTSPSYYSPPARQAAASPAGDPADVGWRSTGQTPSAGGSEPVAASATIPAGYVENAAPPLRMADVNSRWPGGSRFRGMRVNDATSPGEPARFEPPAANTVGSLTPPAIDLSGGQLDVSQSGNTNVFASPAAASASEGGGSGAPAISPLAGSPAGGLLFRPPAIGRSPSP